jgi:glycosyltransferase involved in cell wall biosynthesis
LASASKEEGFGLPIIEAQMIGTPVVCSDMTIFHEVAGDGALFFDYNSPKQFANQVLKLNDSRFENDLVEKGHKQAEKFTWKQSAKKLYDICREISKK